ncbi:MAG: iron ABC transporter permease [Deltaproteobacteria bacterium]
MRARALPLVLVAIVAYALLPWYAVEDGLFDPALLAFYPVDHELAPAPWQVVHFGKTWLVVLLPPILAPLFVVKRPRSEARAARVWLASGALGLALGLGQGVLIGPLGWGPESFDAWLGPLGVKQYGMGAGALVVHTVFVCYVAYGLAARGFVRGDTFVVTTLLLIVASVGVFVFFPVVKILARAFETSDGVVSPLLLFDNLASARVWRVALRSLLLALCAGFGSTLLGFCFALLVTRTSFRFKRIMRALTVLPVITPPFVIGLALILLFGRAGAVTTWVAETFGVPPTRYIFGFAGVLLAQILSFTPIAFMVLIGVVEGVSPSMEEAAQTLRADRFATFRTVSLPLMRPGLANAFLLGFIESLADFGNPLVLGGDDDVLATEIYFAVAGAQSDLSRAAALAILLLTFTLAAFFLQRRWVGKKSYTTVTGKADAGAPCPLPRPLDALVRGVAIPWTVFTAIVYGMIVFGGFVRIWGRDHTLTFEHYADVFAVTNDLQLVGGAWDSLFTTVGIAAVAAPLTALIGLATAYLLARQRFAGHAAFELGTMLSFAIPGTVIGVSYVLAFNVPPIELTGSAVILVACFVFRNMPVGVRAGLATLSQIDGSLDEASLTLGATAFGTVRRVVLPLLRPALVAALVYGFVRAMTAVSAVIFLVSADHNLATTYILGRVENGDYGPAIAYSSVLIALMMLAIASIEWVVGRREVGRRSLA